MTPCFSIRVLLCFVLACMPAACGGGGLDSGGIGGSGFVEGPIEGFGSVIVAGVHFEVNEATITVNGELGDDQDLEIGMRVGISGTINGDTGIATIVEFEEDLRGPVESVSPLAGTMVVVGRTVHFDDNTLLVGVDPNDLPLGTRVRVSGLEEDDEEIRATRIDSPAGDRIQIRGHVRNLNSGGENFRLPPIFVDFSSATFIGARADDLSNATVVSVRGTLSGSRRVLTATQVRVLDPAGAADIGDQVRVAGIVRTQPDGDQFTLASGRTVVLDANTVIEDGTLADIQRRARVRVSGNIIGTRTRILASKVQILRSAP
ncbi:MAG: hypothetical protein ACI91F_003613 [Candidatus Binatia bacterium]|jgi:hypothetical protein